MSHSIVQYIAMVSMLTAALAAPPYEGRIVGGEATTIERFPYQASIQLHQEHICGGAVIGQRLVLTAAHCFEEPWAAIDYSVRVGSGQHASGGHLLSVEKIISHEAYDAQSHDNDLALVVLNARLNYTEQLQPVKVATAAVGGAHLYVSGWGLEREEDEAGVSPVLRFVELDLIKPEQCKAAYSGVLPVTERMLCAGRKGRDSCQGDSGGPLVGRLAGSQEGQLYGVVSWGLGCAQAQYPGIYTRLQAFGGWLKAQLAT